MNAQYITIDGLNWALPPSIRRYTEIEPHCPKEHLEFDFDVNNAAYIHELTCDDCGNKYDLKRSLLDEQKYVWRKYAAEAFKTAEVIKLDDIYIPVAKEKIKSDETNPYGVQVRLVTTRTGSKQLVIYVGEKGKKNAQIFADIDNSKLSFDHKDGHPFGIFTVIEATFKDGTISTIKSSEARNE